MTLLKWRVFNVALLLAMAVMMPGAINAQTQMTEIQLGSGGGGAGGAQSMSPAAPWSKVNWAAAQWRQAQLVRKLLLLMGLTFGWPLNSTIRSPE